MFLLDCMQKDGQQEESTADKDKDEKARNSKLHLFDLIRFMVKLDKISVKVQKILPLQIQNFEY